MGSNNSGLPKSLATSRWSIKNAEPVNINLEIPQLQATEVYYSICSMIDWSNGLCQDDLEIEQILGTQKWSTQVNLIRVVYSYFFYKTCSGNKESSIWCFTNLAEEMIDIMYNHRSTWADLVQLPRQPNKDSRMQQSPHSTPMKKKWQRRNRPETNRTMQGNCKVCKKSNHCKVENP